MWQIIIHGYLNPIRYFFPVTSRGYTKKWLFKNANSSLECLTCLTPLLIWWVLVVFLVFSYYKKKKKANEKKKTLGQNLSWIWIIMAFRNQDCYRYLLMFSSKIENNYFIWKALLKFHIVHRNMNHEIHVKMLFMLYIYRG